MDQKEVKRNHEKAKAREQRRRRRRRIVMAEKITAAVLGVVVLAGSIFLIYNLIPDIKVARQLEEASAYVETNDIDSAIASCEEALEIDSSSVQAYSAMAGAYLTREDTSSAEQILYQGWETTQDESLLQYYCTVLLNEAVADINAQSCSLMTLDKCVSVLEKNADNADAYRLMDVCCERLFQGNPEQEGLLCNTTEGESCGYDVYQDMMLRLLLVYESNPSEELKAEIVKLAVPGENLIWLDVTHLEEYQELLGRVMELESSEELTQLQACVTKAMEMQDFFAEAFTIFESGDFAPVREFMNSETYLSIRDQFISGTMDYWYGQTYIPVSREKMKFIREDEGWMFAFADYEECESTAGVINVWGAKQEDAGVQRVCISYEPASENGEYYPHTTYEFIYLYSNVEVAKEEYVPQMNYRFETRVETPEGTTTQLIGDWGGEHEWTTEF